MVDVDDKKALVSNNVSFAEKNYEYFIGYSYNDNKLSYDVIKLPKASAYVKGYDGQPK